MKNKLLKLGMLAVSVSLAASLFTFVGCGDSTEEMTEKQEILNYIKSLDNVEVDGVNTYATSYDDMVAYLTEQGVITVSQSAAVNMTTNTAGYLSVLEDYIYDYYPDYDPETFTYEFADKAYDFGGVWLIWYDLSGNGSETAASVWSSVANLSQNGNNLVAGGGLITISVSTASGAYVLGFASDYDETAKAEAIEVFEAIDSTPTSLDYYTLDDLALTLRNAGYLTASEYINPTDLNAVYTYEVNGTTCYVYLAPEAKKYGNISIYYYDSAYNYDNLTFYYIFANLEESGSSIIYYDPNYGYYYGADQYIYTYTGTEFDEDGEQLILTADLVIGNFAIVIDED